MSALAIDVSGLTKAYGGRKVVDGVQLQLAAGRICGFLGPNGSGKTTTIRLLCGLLRPDAGSGTCLGLDLREQAARIKRQVGYMPQRFGLYEDLSIRENLDFVAREVVGAEEIIDYTTRENVAERLAKRFGASVGAGAVKALRELAPVR